MTATKTKNKKKKVKKIEKEAVTPEVAPDESIKCPACDRIFKNTQGRGKHIHHSHPELATKKSQLAKQKVEVPMDLLQELLQAGDLLSRSMIDPGVKDVVTKSQSLILNAEMALNVTAVDQLERARRCFKVLDLLQKRIEDVLTEERIKKTTSITDLIRWFDILSKISNNWVALAHKITNRIGESDQRARLLQFIHQNLETVKGDMRDVSGAQEKLLTVAGMPKGSRPADRAKVVRAIAIAVELRKGG